MSAKNDLPNMLSKVAKDRNFLEITTKRHNRLAAGVLGDSLGAFRDSVLGQFTGQEKTDCSLDFSAGDG